MAARISPQNFLLHLRNHRPDLARLTDGLRGLSYVGGILEMKIDSSTWPGCELAERTGEFRSGVEEFFGPAAKFSLQPAKSDPERLPFPIEASKHWNHVVFVGFDPAGGGCALAVRKTVYSARMISGAMTGEDWSETFSYSWPQAGGQSGARGFAAALPELLDALCEFTRLKMSYAQFLLPFPGHEEADLLEARLHSIRDWGTPTTPPAILQKYTGRVHYCDPLAVQVGIKMSLSVSRK